MQSQSLGTLANGRQLISHGPVTTELQESIDYKKSIPAAPSFEYKIIELRLYATEAELNVLGGEGWQLVSESVHEDQVRYVFCRSRQQQST